MEGDPEADALVDSLYAEGPHAYRLVSHALRSASTLAEVPWTVPTALRAFLTEGAEPFARETAGELARMARGTAFYADYRLPISLVMQWVTMPVLYTSQTGAQILTCTGRLQQEAIRRAAETAHFTFDVCAAGGFAPEGRAFMSCKRVRLLHAVVRRQILRSGRWDVARDGVPINAMTLLGTVGPYSVLVTDALRRLGVPVSDDEAEGFYTLWRAAGRLLGVDEALLPDRSEAFRPIFEAVLRREIGATPEGRRLFDTWVHAAGQPLKVLGGENGFRRIVRTLVSDDVADALGMTVAPLSDSALGAVRSAFTIADRALARGTVRRRWARALMNRAIEGDVAKNVGRRTSDFALPHAACPHAAAA
jgi:hypothetical protein